MISCKALQGWLGYSEE